MELDYALEKLRSSEEFKAFSKENLNYYFVHAFILYEEGKRAEWQFGFYNKKSDRIIVFEVSELGNKITQSPEEDVFKKSGIVKELDLKTVKISLDQAFETVHDFRKRKYPKEIIDREIVILQHLKKQVWNITLSTATFKLINVKVDAASGKILEDSINSLLQWKK